MLTYRMYAEFMPRRGYIFVFLAPCTRTKLLVSGWTLNKKTFSPAHAEEKVYIYTMNQTGINRLILPVGIQTAEDRVLVAKTRVFMAGKTG
jgi:hypothetical protein